MSRPANPPESRLITVSFCLSVAGLENLRRLAEADRRPVASMARILVEQGLVRHRPTHSKRALATVEAS